MIDAQKQVVASIREIARELYKDAHGSTRGCMDRIAAAFHVHRTVLYTPSIAFAKRVARRHAADGVTFDRLVNGCPFGRATDARRAAIVRQIRQMLFTEDLDADEHTFLLGVLFACAEGTTLDGWRPDGKATYAGPFRREGSIGAQFERCAHMGRLVDSIVVVFDGLTIDRRDARPEEYARLRAAQAARVDLERARSGGTKTLQNSTIQHAGQESA